MNAWRIFCSRQTCQNNAPSINQLERKVHTVNVGRARAMDWQQALFFLLPSPRLALRAKYRVRLAWLIKRLFCRLLWRGHSCSHCRRGYYDCCCSWSWDIYAWIPEWVNTDETRGDEYSLKNRRGRLRPAVQPLILLYTIFDRKGTPFIHLLLTNGTPFTYQVSNIASQLTAVSKTWINHKSRTFPRLFHSHKMHLLAPLGLN